MKILKKILIILLFVILGILALALLVMLASRTFNLISHRIRSDNGMNTSRYVNLGGMEQFIRIRTEDPSNPLIIYLHGGPGSPDSFTAYRFADGLDEDYTVISWDQRGAGRTYEHNKKIDPDNETVSFERALTDLDELVDYARKEFNQDQVIILGHSYGTMLGTHYVLNRPEKVMRYIGIGQLANPVEGERRSYEDALAKAKASGTDTAAMEAAWTEFEADPGTLTKMLAVRKFTIPYHTAPKRQNDIWHGISSPYMGISDFRYFLRQLNIDEVLHLQASLFDGLLLDMTQYTDFKVPVDFIQGDYDWTCPTVCAKEYMDTITAPSKGFHVIEGSGHSPQHDDPEAFAEVVRNILR